jgi:hypothetical protein
MTTDETNAVPFAPRRPEPPALEFVELRLGDDCSIEMTLRDSAGDVVAVLEYAITFKPKDFDLDLLRAAWARWRGSSSAAS